MQLKIRARTPAALWPKVNWKAKDNPNYKLIATMTQIGKSQQAWDGKTGYINTDMLVEVIPDLRAPIYYSAGPPEMVASMRKMLQDSGVNEDHIRTEDFAGY